MPTNYLCMTLQWFSYLFYFISHFPPAQGCFLNNNGDLGGYSLQNKKCFYKLSESIKSYLSLWTLFFFFSNLFKDVSKVNMSNTLRKHFWTKQVQPPKRITSATQWFLLLIFPPLNSLIFLSDIQKKMTDLRIRKEFYKYLTVEVRNTYTQPA